MQPQSIQPQSTAQAALELFKTALGYFAEAADYDCKLIEGYICFAYKKNDNDILLLQICDNLKITIQNTDKCSKFHNEYMGVSLNPNSPETMQKIQAVANAAKTKHDQIEQEKQALLDPFRGFPPEFLVEQNINIRSRQISDSSTAPAHQNSIARPIADTWKENLLAILDEQILKFKTKLHCNNCNEIRDTVICKDAEQFKWENIQKLRDLVANPTTTVTAVREEIVRLLNDPKMHQETDPTLHKSFSIPFFGSMIEAAATAVHTIGVIKRLEKCLKLLPPDTITPRFH